MPGKDNDQRSPFCLAPGKSVNSKIKKDTYSGLNLFCKFSSTRLNIKLRMQVCCENHSPAARDFHSHFDNIMTQFVINKSTDA